MPSRRATVLMYGPPGAIVARLEERDGAWAVGSAARSDVAAEPGSAEWAAAAAELAKAVGAREIRIALPAGDCFLRELTVPFTEDEPIRETLPFEMAQVVPGVKADDVAADYLAAGSTESSARIVAFGAKRLLLGAMRDALAKQGIKAVSFAPEIACWLTGAVTAAGGVATEGAQVFVGSSSGRLLMAWYQDGVLGGVRSIRVSGDAEALARRAAREIEMVAGGEARVFVAGEDGLRSGLEARGVEATALEPPSGEAELSVTEKLALAGAASGATCGTSRELSLSADGPTDGGPAKRRKRLTILAMSALLALMCASGLRQELALRHFESEQSRIRKTELEIYTKCFEGRKPISAFSFAENVERELAGLRGGAGWAQGRPDIVSALEQLAEIGRRLPAGVSYSITRARVSQDGVILWGETTEFTGVDRIESALNRSDSLTANTSERKLVDDGGAKKVTFEIRIKGGS